ncbi:MAG: hypothetical protein LBR60_01800 [Fibrobacter sp.]|jgi:hypothetical protein|nr:hypothetical protein [Fibrobacter sp.]
MAILNRSFLFLILILAAGFLQVSAKTPVLSAERSYNLKTIETAPLLFEYHRLTTTPAKQLFYFPRRDSTWRKDYRKTEKNALFFYDGGNQSLAASLIGGADYRGSEALQDTMFPALDGGIYLRGFRDSVEFMLDARIYMESHSALHPKSFDREFVEFQKSENNSGVEYASYARYRGHFSIHTGWARFDLARDIIHLGPGFYNNLTLNQFAVPYNMFSMEFQVGPLSVVSFYADLRIYNQSMSMKNSDDRNLYGHRYELDLGNLTVGISEIQVLYNINKPWLFVPVVPLFMEKGNFPEDRNNGALSFDLNYRLFNAARIYTEFFLDDMESPVSLIKNDNIEAKWAWMAGIQSGFNTEVNGFDLELGAIAEYARVEPYVYTHFKQNTAQLGHLGYPLGNQGGPNSQTIDFTLYGRLHRQVFLGLRNTWFWKGTDYGSALNDTTPRQNHMNIPKEFLKGAKMEYSLTPALSYDGKYFGFMMELTLFNERRIYSRLGFKW